MPAPAKHIIQRQTVWLDQPPKLPAFVLQERLSAYCRDTLPGVLESVFDGVADADTIIRLDTLDLDAGTVSLARFEEQLTQRIRQQTEQALNRLLNNREPGDTQVQRYSRTDRLGQQFWFFLHHGYFPAWADTEAVTPFSDWLMSELAELFRRELRSILPDNPSVARRLIGHSSDAALMRVFSPTADTALSENLMHFFRSIHQIINHLSLSVIREQYWLNQFRAGEIGDSERSYLTDFYESLYRLNVAMTGKNDLLIFFETLLQPIDSATRALPSTDRAAFLKTLQQLINQASILQPNRTKQPERKTLTDTGAKIDSATEEENRSHIKATDSGELPRDKRTDIEAANQPNAANESSSAKQPTDNESDTVELALTQHKDSLPLTESVHDSPVYVDSLEPTENSRTDSVSESAQKPTKQNRRETPLPDSEIYVPMAGIVLLHPFLTTLFTEMGLVHNRLWISPEASKKGVQVLAWLATGTAFCPEYTMPLLKLLCGLPVDAVVSPDILLTDTEKTLTTEVLEAVLTHWTVLKNTSTAGLQEAFLQREGKLTAVDGGWRLVVERKTIDILLDKLPWGVSMVKLPWMPNLLFVDWI